MTCEIGSPVSFARVLPVWEAGVGCSRARKVAESPQSEREGRCGHAPSWAAQWQSHLWLGWRCGAGGGRPSPLSSTGGTAHIMLAHTHTHNTGLRLERASEAARQRGSETARRHTFMAGSNCGGLDGEGRSLSCAHCTASVGKAGLGAAVVGSGRSEGTGGWTGVCGDGGRY